MSVVLRRILLLAILFLPQRFWLGRGWRLLGRMPSQTLKWAGRLFLVLATIAMVFVLYDRIVHKFLPEPFGYVFAPPIQLWVFTSIFAFFCLLPVHFIGWLWSRIVRLRTGTSHPSAIDPGRRSVFRYATAVVGGLPFLAAVYGFAAERLRFRVVRVDVPIRNLPAALDGLRVAQLSDIHSGDFMPPDEIRRAVEMANSLEPHLAVVTGDFITSHGDPLAECIAELSRLKAPLGIFGCNGNHEIYAGAEAQAETLFAGHGMKLLRQSAAALRWNGEEFNLIGVDYQRDVQLTGSKKPGLAGVESLLKPGVPNILLSHNPNAFNRAAELGVDLTLSGHTHGGQINVEIVNHSLNPARFMTRFIAGLYHLPKSRNSADRAWLYVNRGLGTLGIPARIGAEPEITLLTLRSA